MTRLLMAICADVLLFLAVIISKSEYHAFEVSIQAFNSLPVIGEEFTLVCTFTPETRNRRVIWTKGNNIVIASQTCVLYPACKWMNVPDRSKFSLMTDTSSGNLTFKTLFRNDSDNYQCKVRSTFGRKDTGSAIFQVSPLPPDRPYLLKINDERFSRNYHNNTNITVTAGEPYNITCAAYGARPPAVLEWLIPDDVAVVHQDQANVVQGYFYISLKTATITPSKNDQGKYLHCLASHKKLQNNLQRSVHLNAHEVNIDSDVNTTLVTFSRDLCSKPDDVTASPGLNNPPFPRKKTSFMIIALGVIASVGLILLISLGLMYFYGTLSCVKQKKGDNIDNTQPEGRMVDDDGLVYMSVSHDHAHPPNAPPIQAEEPTVYASLNPEVTQHRKGQTEYADTKATTPDGQPMYGNYLVKERKQEQARIPPLIQTDNVSYDPECMDGRKGGMKGAMGPTTPDGQPVYENYLVKMHKDKERAKQMAGTHGAFEMYDI